MVDAGIIEDVGIMEADMEEEEEEVTAKDSL